MDIIDELASLQFASLIFPFAYKMTIGILPAMANEGRPRAAFLIRCRAHTGRANTCRYSALAERVGFEADYADQDSEGNQLWDYTLIAGLHVRRVFTIARS